MAFVSTGVTVISTTTPVLLASTSGKANVHIRNNAGPDHIYVGDSNVSAATGRLMLSTEGANFNLLSAGSIYSVTVNGSATVVSVIVSS